ncbi:MAG: YciI-like protein [Sphingomonas fennica]
MRHWLLRYTLAPDYLDRRGTYRAEHLALAWAAADRGALLLGGAAGDPPGEALLLFAGDDAGEAEAFARADPYVANGLVTGWTILPWAAVVGEGAATPVRPGS